MNWYAILMQGALLGGLYALFAIGLSAYSMVKIIVQAFYAMHDTWTPVAVGLFTLMVDIGLNFLFAGRLKNGGPALAASLAAFFDTIVLLTIFRRRHGRLGLGGILKACVKFAIASAAMAGVIYFVISYPGFYAGSMTHRSLALAAIIAIATVTYFLVARLLRVNELQELGGIFARRVPS